MIGAGRWKSVCVGVLKKNERDGLTMIFQLPRKISSITHCSAYQDCDERSNGETTPWTMASEYGQFIARKANKTATYNGGHIFD
jgi:hypothetical protein